MKKYLVSGKYKGKNIDQRVSANSKKQAKIKAGYYSGFGGSYMSDFLKSKTLSVEEI